MQARSLFSPPPHMSDVQRRARRHLLAQTGLAWLIMMQVMMLAFPGYLRPGVQSAQSLLALQEAIVLMNWLSLILCVPLVLYCAWPVWRGAWASLGQGRVGMDVPVALGILAAFVPSVWATWQGVGEVYFDSVSMFVAFLLSARFLQYCAGQAVGQYAPIDPGLMRQGDRLAFWFVCIQLLLAVLVGLWWWVWQPQHAVAVTVALLVMSCPCALAMSIPAAQAARQAAWLRTQSGQSGQTTQGGSGGGSCPADDAWAEHRMQQIARQNLMGSLAWHVLMTPLAAMGWVQPWLAAITMLLSSVAVAANAWRLVHDVHLRALPQLARAR
ncbi:hypothetical protein [Castellaniella sp.]|uniref:P-type ATPase n=1 Tax=Castellaniella sp. TaxID=1955812 RepID=UPI003C78B706